MYCNLNDQKLISLLKEGDELVYIEIYNRYKKLLQNQAYKKPIYNLNQNAEKWQP